MTYIIKVIKAVDFNKFHVSKIIATYIIYSRPVELKENWNPEYFWLKIKILILNQLPYASQPINLNVYYNRWNKIWVIS